MDPFCYFSFMFVFVILPSLFFAALLSPAGESTGLLALVLVVFSCDVVTFPNGESSHVWYLIVSIPDLYLPLYLDLFQPIF